MAIQTPRSPATTSSCRTASAPLVESSDIGEARPAQLLDTLSASTTAAASELNTVAENLSSRVTAASPCVAGRDDSPIDERAVRKASVIFAAVSHNMVTHSAVWLQRAHRAVLHRGPDVRAEDLLATVLTEDDLAMVLTTQLRAQMATLPPSLCLETAKRMTTAITLPILNHIRDVQRHARSTDCTQPSPTATMASAAAATATAGSQEPYALLCAPPPPEVAAVGEGEFLQTGAQAASPTAAADTTRSAGGGTQPSPTATMASAAAATATAGSQEPYALLSAPPPPEVAAVGDDEGTRIDKQAAASAAAADTAHSSSGGTQPSPTATMASAAAATATAGSREEDALLNAPATAELAARSFITIFNSLVRGVLAHHRDSFIEETISAFIHFGVGVGVATYKDGMDRLRAVFAEPKFSRLAASIATTHPELYAFARERADHALVEVGTAAIDAVNARLRELGIGGVRFAFGADAAAHALALPADQPLEAMAEFLSDGASRTGKGAGVGLSRSDTCVAGADVPSSHIYKMTTTITAINNPAGLGHRAAKPALPRHLAAG